MSISPPHGPIHEEKEFWYDPNEKALLYEVDIHRETGEAFPDHQRSAERGHSVNVLWREHRPVHYQPHGISFNDATAQDGHGGTNVANTELVVPIWCQITNNEQPARAGLREPLIPIPKVLALFLAAKQEDMYRDESLTQAIALLYTYMATRGNSQPPPR